MSDTQRYTGKLRLMHRKEGQDIEQQCKELVLMKHGLELPEWFDSYTEYLKDELSKNYLVANGEVWEFVELTKQDPYESYIDMHDNGDGTYSFSTSFYDGSTWLGEMCRNGLERVLSEKQGA